MIIQTSIQVNAGISRVIMDIFNHLSVWAHLHHSRDAWLHTEKPVPQRTEKTSQTFFKIMNIISTVQNLYFQGMKMADEEGTLLGALEYEPDSGDFRLLSYMYNEWNSIRLINKQLYEIFDGRLKCIQCPFV